MVSRGVRTTAAVAAAAALSLAACSGAQVEETFETLAPPETVVATTATTTEAGPVLSETPLEGFEERSVVFANIELAVAGVRVSNQDTRSYAEGGDPVVAEGSNYAYLDMTATNLTSGTQIAIGDEAFALELDGEVIAPDSSMSFLSDIPGFIQPNSTVASFLAFPILAEADLSTAALVVGAPGDRTEILPLTGAVPVPDYPVTVEVTGSAPGVGPTNGGIIEFTVLDVTLAEDVPHEQATSPTGDRADDGELFIVVHLRAEKVEGRGSDLIGNGLRLLVDGEPQAPWDVADDPAGSTATPMVEEGASAEAWAAFLISQDVTDLILQVGDFDEDPGLIPLDIIPLP